MGESDLFTAGDLKGTYMRDIQDQAQYRTIIVVPTNRPERIEAFLSAWAQVWPQGNVPEIYVIRDAVCPDRYTALKARPNVSIFYHADIDRDLGRSGACIDRFSPGVRSYGIWKAAQAKPDMIWTTDDDCMPLNGQDAVSGHREMLFGYRQPERWFPLRSIDNQDRTVFHRGHPYAADQRNGAFPVLNHGLVAGMPDIDALTQLPISSLIGSFSALETKDTVGVPRSYYFPMSIQNVAFKPEIAPLMYLPKLSDGMKRWSDIWCGLIMKKVCDAHGLPVTSGAPCVLHERASNVFANLRQEWAGYEINERLWKVIDGVDLSNIPQVPFTQGALVDDYLCVAAFIEEEFPELAIMVEGMRGWAKLWT